MEHSRTSVSTCLYREAVYLCGIGSSIIEAFVPATSCYLPIPQGQCKLREESAYLFPQEEELVLITLNQQKRYCKRKGKHLIETANRAIESVIQPANSELVILGKVVYWSCEGACYSITSDNGLKTAVWNLR